MIWRIRLARRADQDIKDILAWTQQQFGPAQTAAYTETLTLALRALIDGPDVLGAKPRDDILPGIRALHVARQGRKGRHLILFRASENQHIDVLRILHDSMDFARHV